MKPVSASLWPPKLPGAPVRQVMLTLIAWLLREQFDTISRAHASLVRSTGLSGGNQHISSTVGRLPQYGANRCACWPCCGWARRAKTLGFAGLAAATAPATAPGRISMRGAGTPGGTNPAHREHRAKHTVQHCCRQHKSWWAGRRAGARACRKACNMRATCLPAEKSALGGLATWPAPRPPACPPAHAPVKGRMPAAVAAALEAAAAAACCAWCGLLKACSIWRPRPVCCVPLAGSTTPSANRVRVRPSLMLQSPFTASPLQRGAGCSGSRWRWRGGEGMASGADWRGGARRVRWGAAACCNTVPGLSACLGLDSFCASLPTRHNP